MYDKIYCINLERRPDRWELAKIEFEKHGLAVERFAAVDANEFKKEYTTKPGACACAFSHLLIIQKAKLLGLNSVLIFEDDAELHPGFVPLFEDCIKDLPEDWDMLYLGGSHQEKPQPVTNKIYRVSKTLTTHAYIIRKSMFDKIIELLTNLEQPIDGIYGDLQKVFNCYVTNPPLAWQRENFSDIEGRNMNYDFIRTNDQHESEQ